MGGQAESCVYGLIFSTTKRKPYIVKMYFDVYSIDMHLNHQCIFNLHVEKMIHEWLKITQHL